MLGVVRVYFAVSAIALGGLVHAQAELPPLPSMLRTVNDDAGVLSDEQSMRLARRLVDILDRTGIRVVVVTLPTVGAEPIDDYADRVALRWGWERRVDPDRMIVVVVAIRDRYLVARPGKGMRLASQLDTRELLGVVGPLFGRGKYYEGLVALADRLQAVIEKNRPPSETAR